MVTNANTNVETIMQQCSWNFVKKGESLCYVNQDCISFLLPSSVRLRLHSTAGAKQRPPFLPQLLARSPSSKGELDISISQPSPIYLLLRLSPRWVQLRGGASFSHPRLTQALPWISPVLRILGFPSLLACSQGNGFHQEDKSEQTSFVPLSKCSTPRKRVSKRSLPLFPLTAPEPWPRFLPGEETGHITVTPNRYPRNWLLFATEWRNSRLEVLLGRVEVMVKDSWEEAKLQVCC
jgi:hypothetical protein